MNRNLEELFFVLAVIFSVLAIIIGIFALSKSFDPKPGACVIFEEEGDGDRVAKIGKYIKYGDGARWVESDGKIYALPNNSLVTECEADK